MRPWKRLCPRGDCGRRLALGALLLLGLALSLAASRASWHWQQHLLAMDFEQAAAERASVIARHLREHLHEVEGLRPFFQTDPPVSRDEFLRYTRELITRDRCLRSLKWIAHLPAAGREAFEGRVRSEGLPDYLIWEQGESGRQPARLRALHYPVSYSVPQAETDFSLGFDLASESRRRETLEQARASGRATVGGRIALLTEEEDGLLLVVPVFGADESGRPQRLPRGYVLGTLRVASAVEVPLATLRPRGLDVSLLDLSAPPEERLLYVHPSRTRPPGAAPDEAAAGPRHETPFELGGRSLAVVCTAAPGFFAVSPSRMPWLVLLAGLALTVLLGAYLFSVQQRGRRVEEEVARQTRGLRESEERLALALDGAELGTWDWRVPDGSVRFNERWAAMLGYRLEELVPDLATWEELVAPEDMPAVREALQAHLAGRTAAYESEHRLRHRDGHWVWVLDKGRVLVRAPDGSPLRVCGTHLDISARKQAEEDLRLFQAIIETSGEAVRICSPEGQLKYINQAHVRLFGRDFIEARTFDCREAYSPESAARLKLEVQPQVRRGLGWEGELEAVAADGRRFPLWQRVDAIRDEQGGLRYLFALMHDLSGSKAAEDERLELERRAFQWQKGECLGRMAAAIAHRFNNLLQAVSGNLELAQLNRALPSGTGERIGQALGATRQAAELSQLMLAYLGQDIQQRDLLDLSGEMQRTLPLLEAAAPGKVAIAADLPSGLPLIEGNSGALRQLVLNLVTNAWEALGEAGGTVRLETGSALYSADSLRQARAEAPPAAGEYVSLMVSDEGCGMDAETVGFMFDPFYTTKFPGRGLGLATVLGVVRAHRGAVLVDSSPGRGSRIRVLLPAAAPAQIPIPEAAASAPVAAPSALSGTVLLAEDDEMGRDATRIMLEMLGFTVCCAVDGADALEQFRRGRDQIVCALLDLTMPRLNGWEVLAAMRAARPDLPVILISGYDEKRVMAGEHRERPQGFLQKPFHLEDLRQTLEQALA